MASPMPPAWQHPHRLGGDEMSSPECTTPVPDIPDELIGFDVRPDPRTGELWASVDAESFRKVADWLSAYAEVAHG